MQPRLRESIPVATLTPSSSKTLWWFRCQIQFLAKRARAGSAYTSGSGNFIWLVPIPALGKQLGSDSATSRSGLERLGSGSLKMHLSCNWKLNIHRNTCSSGTDHNKISLLILEGDNGHCNDIGILQGEKKEKLNELSDIGILQGEKKEKLNELSGKSVEIF